MPNIALIRAVKEFQKLHFTASASPNPSHPPKRAMRIVKYGSGGFGSLPCKIPIPETPVEILYIGEAGGMEEQMIAENFGASEASADGPDSEMSVKFKGIACGKMRRYFSLRNFVDFFKVPIGIWQAFKAIRAFKPRAIFCKGGYVSFPVAVGGWLAKVPIFLHESDVVPGLTNRLCARFAQKICVAFEESRKYFPAKKVIVTGNLVRTEMAIGDAEKGLLLANFKDTLPTILVMGGSQGADFINKIIWDNLNDLLENYQVIHICGDGKIKEPKYFDFSNKENLGRYKTFGFVGEELKDLYACTDLIISRAGAMSLAEFELIEKPVLLIPLSKKTSRGDQIINAKTFAKTNLATVIEEEKYLAQTFLKAIENLLKESKKYQKKSIEKNHGHKKNGTQDIINLLVNA